MSYIQFQQQCNACKETWNAEFGIVGITQIASPPTCCPHCASNDIVKIADGWKLDQRSANEKMAVWHELHSEAYPEGHKYRAMHANIAKSLRERAV